MLAFGREIPTCNYNWVIYNEIRSTQIDTICLNLSFPKESCVSSHRARQVTLNRASKRAVLFASQLHSFTVSQLTLSQTARLLDFALPRIYNLQLSWLYDFVGSSSQRNTCAASRILDLSILIYSSTWRLTTL